MLQTLEEIGQQWPGRLKLRPMRRRKFCQHFLTARCERNIDTPAVVLGRRALDITMFPQTIHKAHGTVRRYMQALGKLSYRHTLALREPFYFQ